MKISDYFDLQNCKSTKEPTRLLETTNWCIFISFIEVSIVSLILSSFNPRTVLQFSGSAPSHLLRTFFLFLIFTALFIQKILIRNKLLNYRLSFILNTLSFFGFSNTFIMSCTFFKTRNLFFFPIEKIYIHSSLLFSITNSLLFSYYLTFYSFFIAVPIYTQSLGLVSYLQSKARTMFLDSKEILTYTTKFSWLLFISYLIFLHTILRVISSVIRICPYFGSIFGLLKFIILSSISNVIFYLIYLLIDYLITFNISYNYNKLDSSSLSLQYHTIIQSYKKKQIKLKPSLIKTIEAHILKEIKAIKKSLSDFILLKKRLEDNLFINVPQVNKNYNEKYKAYTVYNYLFSKIFYCVVKFLLVKKTNFLLENFVSILEVIITVKENDNISVMSIESQLSLVELIKEANDVDISMSLGLRTYDIEKIINKLN